LVARSQREQVIPLPQGTVIPSSPAVLEIALSMGLVSRRARRYLNL
jgi:hypothetical protein